MINTKKTLAKTRQVNSLGPTASDLAKVGLIVAAWLCHVLLSLIGIWYLFCFYFPFQHKGAWHRSRDLSGCASGERCISWAKPSGIVGGWTLVDLGGPWWTLVDLPVKGGISVESVESVVWGWVGDSED